MLNKYKTQNYEYLLIGDELPQADENNLLVKEYSTDGLHLTEKGYEIWTNTLKEHLR